MRRQRKGLSMQMQTFVRVIVVGLSALCLITVQAALVKEWRVIHEERERQASVRQEVLRLERLVADVDNGFRGYMLVKEAGFLGPMVSAEGTIPGVVERLSHLTESWPEVQGRIRVLGERVTELLDTKRRLTLELEYGAGDAVLAYIRGGDGLALAKTIALAFQDLNDKLDKRHNDQRAIRKTEWVQWGLMTTAAAGLFLGIGVGRSTRYIPRNPASDPGAFRSHHPSTHSQDQVRRDAV